MNNHQLQMEERKMDFSKEDLIRLLSLLKSELQTKEIALASMKSEQLKRLINPIEISRSSLANAYIELQDRFKVLDQNNNAKHKAAAAAARAQGNNTRNTQQETSSSQTELPDKNDYFSSDENDRECLNILSTLLELLDRHPLLALPRDTIYCLDYNCNELSTKNYLNIKIQQLDNLINQHRRFRYYMSEHLRRSEQRCLELSRELELERTVKRDNEKSFYNLTGKSVLLKHINQLKETLEIEKRNKQEIVMTLLNELLDERERCDSLTRRIAEQKTTASDSVDKISREKEKLFMLESELNSLATQMRKQTSTLTKERNDLFSKVTDLEQENSILKAKILEQNKRLNQYQLSNNDTNSNNQSSPSKTHITIKQVSPATPISRNTPNSAISKSSANVKVTNTTSTTPSTPTVLNRTTLNRSQTSSTKDSTTPEQSSPKGSLLKSSSASFSGQSGRNAKISTIGSSGSMGSNSRTPPCMPKPQVPAKPAQLLDQRNSKA